jgi:hypothetical protein
MIFGGLSEDEIEKIKSILDQEGVTYKAGVDGGILKMNDQSMRDNLRHYKAPDVSTHILAIEIEDEDFQKLSSTEKEGLLHYGITDVAPSPEDFETPTGVVKRPEKIGSVHSVAKLLIFIFLASFAFVMGRLIFM